MESPGKHQVAVAGEGRSERDTSESFNSSRIFCHSCSGRLLCAYLAETWKQTLKGEGGEVCIWRNLSKPFNYSCILPGLKIAHYELLMVGLSLSLSLGRGGRPADGGLLRSILMPAVPPVAAVSRGNSEDRDSVNGEIRGAIQ